MGTITVMRGNSARSLNHWQDSADMFNTPDTGKCDVSPAYADILAIRANPKPPTKHISLGPMVSADHELWRVRNLPHLYDDWYIDLVNEQREQYVDTLGDVTDWDCKWCKHSVITQNTRDLCPNCGRAS